MKTLPRNRKTFALSYYDQIFKSFILESFEENETVFNVGDIGDKFYLILEGEVAVCINRSDEEIEKLYKDQRKQMHAKEKFIDVVNSLQDLTGVEENVFFKAVKNSKRPLFYRGVPSMQIRKILMPGDTFGEIALSYSNIRTASIIATKECKLLSLSKTSFLQICDNMADFTSHFIKFLKTSFPGLTSKNLANIMCDLKLKSVPLGFKLLEAGKKPEKCYIIKSGSCKVKIPIF